MEQIKLDMIPKGITPIAHASQYDQGRLIHFILMDNLQAFILTDETVTIKVCKPDNNIVTTEVTYTANTNIVTISTTEQMTAVAGDSKCELSITKNNIKVGSLNFILRVEEDPLKDGVESETVIANLDTIIDNAVSEALNDTVLYGAYPTAEIDNVPIASFSDGADDVPVKALQIGINAIQEGSGTPSPQNIRNLIGFTGANITDIGANWFHQTAWTETENGITVPTGTNINANLYNGKLPKGTFYIKDFTGGSNTTHQIVVIKDGTVLDYVTSNTYTLTVDDTNYNSTWVIRLYLYTGNTDSLIKPIMSTSIPTTYRSYVAPTTTAISWQDEAGTVYRGLLDVTTGKLTVTHAFIEYDGSSDETFQYNSAYDGFRIKIENAGIFGIPSVDLLSNIFVGADKRGEVTPDFTMCTYSGTTADDGKYIFFCGTGMTDVNAFKTWLSGNNTQVVYPLATPVTYQLTPTQISAILGTNNVFTDTGDIQNLIYRRDMNSIVEAIPAPPSTDGTYSLKCTVSGGVASYSWVAD